MIGGADAADVLAGLKPWAGAAPAITDSERTARLEKARRLTAEAGGDALLVNAGMSLRYFAGVPWGASERLVAMLLPVSGEPVMICPAFELGSLTADMQIAAGMRLWQEDEDPFALVADAARGWKKLLVDPALPFQMALRLKASAPWLELADGAPAIDGCRMYKSPTEIALMQRAKDITLHVHRLAASILHPGIAASAVKQFINEAHRALAGSPSTFCIVQFGRATAFPHGLPGDQQLADGEMVLIDTGTQIGGYTSDITRTSAFGSVGQEEHDIWALEKEAQAAAFAAARPGESCESVDAAARRVLEKAGLGPGYALPGLPHRTGHGIGLSIHEPAYLVKGDRTPLGTGMCFSNEPMIVVPDRFGVRLEDHFHMTESGAKWFTQPQRAIDAL